MNKDNKYRTNSPIQAQIDIEFLYLDLNSCTRCVGTDKNLEEAIKEVERVVGLAGSKISVNKILIDSEEKAQQHHFSISPTLRVNGHNIALETIESLCDSCTDLCGCDEGTSCRIWLYKGKEHTEAPVAMIVDALLMQIYSSPTKKKDTDISLPVSFDEVPQNLKSFFSSQKQSVDPPGDHENVVSDCCSAEHQQKCCEPSEKSQCCGTNSEPSSESNSEPSSESNGCGCL